MASKGFSVEEFVIIAFFFLLFVGLTVAIILWGVSPLINAAKP
jgi:hypothetical protein